VNGSAAAGYSSDLDRTVVRAVHESVVSVGTPLAVTATLTTAGSNAVRAFYYTDHLPVDMEVATVSVTVDDAVAVGYTYEVGSADEVYPGTIPHRWIIESPPGLAENTPVNSSCVIEYTVTSMEAGDYTPPGYMWVGYDMEAGSGLFGYETDPPSFQFQQPVLDAGDVNDDGWVDAVDVQTVINAVLGLDTDWDCDLDGNETVDAIDIQLVINAVLGLW
jgi:hypothetical protein